MKKGLIKSLKVILILILMLILTTSSIFASSISIQSPSAMLIDSKTGEVLYEKNIDEQRAIASTTKIMTYLLVMEAIDQGKINMNDKVNISKVAAETKGSSYKLKAGDKLTVRELIDSMIIISANDSAVALAEHVSGSVYEFSNLMNRRSQELGLERAHFVNPNGLPLINNDQNKLTARSLAKLVDYTLKKYEYDLIKTSKKKYFVGSYKSYSKQNTNRIVQTSNIVDGLKTGYTDLAGYCLISTYKHPQDLEHRLISIVLGSKSSNQRFEDSLKLIEYGIHEYNNIRLVKTGEVLGRDTLYRGEKAIPIELVATRNLDKFSPIKAKINITDEIYISEGIYEEEILDGRELKAKIKLSDGTESEIFLKANRGTTVFVNNHQIDFKGLNPIIKDGTTLVPLRTLSEHMGFEVIWNGDSKSISVIKEKNTIELKVGSNVVKKDGKEIKLNRYTEIINNSTFVPVRFISESLNKDVEWRGDTKEIFIHDKEIQTN